MQLEKRTKEIALIISMPRSGSTLLKALLGKPQKTSHFPEIDFQKYEDIEEIKKISEKEVIVLKKPAWVKEINSYPKIRFEGAKKIILFREPLETISSMKKMALGKTFYFIGLPANKWILKKYWHKVYRNILERFKEDDDAIFVKYERLVENPKKVTKKIFNFLGMNEEGIESYGPPKEGWKWGQDDGSKNIKNLKVNKNKEHKDKILKNIIENDAEVQKLIEEYEKISI